MTNDNKPPEPAQPVPHPLLAALNAQLSGVEQTATYDIAGHKYTLQTLSPYEETWADQFVEGANFYQTGRNRRVPYVAAALKDIDGVTTRELFQLPKGLDPETKRLYDENALLEEEWRRRQVMRWIATSVPPPVLSELWDAYQALDAQRKEALEKIGPLSSAASGGPSPLTWLLGRKA